APCPPRRSAELGGGGRRSFVRGRRASAPARRPSRGTPEIASLRLVVGPPWPTTASGRPSCRHAPNRHRGVGLRRRHATAKLVQARHLAHLTKPCVGLRPALAEFADALLGTSTRRRHLDERSRGCRARSKSRRHLEGRVFSPCLPETV